MENIVEPREIKRSELPDILKGLAVIFMIAVHIIELFANTEIYHSGFGKIVLFLGGPPAAPIFMIVMGYYFAASSKPSAYFIKRGLYLLGLGFILNILINLNLFYHIYEGKSAVNPFQFLFGADILHLAGLTFLILGGFQKALKEFWVFGIILAVLFQFVNSVFSPPSFSDFEILRYVFAFIWSNENWSFFAVIPWISYPLTGMAFYAFNKRYPKLIEDFSKQYFILIFWLIFLSYLTGYLTTSTSTLKIYYGHDILFYFVTLIFLSGYILVINFVTTYLEGNILLKATGFLGKKVTIAYFVQWILIGNIATSIYRSLGYTGTMLSIIGAIIVVFFLTYFFDKYPLKTIWKEIKKV